MATIGNCGLSSCVRGANRAVVFFFGPLPFDLEDFPMKIIYTSQFVVRRMYDTTTMMRKKAGLN